MAQDDGSAGTADFAGRDRPDIAHRLRNVLAVIRSIVRRTGETSDTVEGFASHLDGRINAYARVLSDLQGEGEVGLDVGYLVAEQLMEFGARESDQVTVEGPPARLTAKATESFGLALHELALNALEHGALSRPEGQLAVDWRFETGRAGAMTFSWRESGAPVFNGPRRNGFGMEFLQRTLPYELGASAAAKFDGDALLWTIILPEPLFLPLEAGPAGESATP